MSICTAVLVHSPLVGPLTWQATAGLLDEAGIATVVVDLRGATQHAGIEACVVRDTAVAEPPIVLVGHSGAGRHLPALAGAVPGVGLLVYVDAALSVPGRSWFDGAPPELAARLTEMVDADGVLPPWPEWFGPDAMAELLPDPGLRRRLVAESPRLPLSYFAEPAPPSSWSGPQVYLRLSDAYHAEAERMRATGTPVITRASHHLAMLTDPSMVADALRTCLAA